MCYLFSTWKNQRSRCSCGMRTSASAARVGWEHVPVLLALDENPCHCCSRGIPTLPMLLAWNPNLARAASVGSQPCPWCSRGIPTLPVVLAFDPNRARAARVGSIQTLVENIYIINLFIYLYLTLTVCIPRADYLAVTIHNTYRSCTCECHVLTKLQTMQYFVFLRASVTICKSKSNTNFENRTNV